VQSVFAPKQDSHCRQLWSESVQTFNWKKAKLKKCWLVGLVNTPRHIAGGRRGCVVLTESAPQHSTVRTRVWIDVDVNTRQELKEEINE
jgi:hypothetical protein